MAPDVAALAQAGGSSRRRQHSQHHSLRIESTNPTRESLSHA
ncbi:hypothetical protein [Vandammella animalimorsus]|nr:hypothetical protein [Vandammella animalimorsus]